MAIEFEFHDAEFHGKREGKNSINLNDWRILYIL
jgi:hypothetical protein